MTVSQSNTHETDVAIIGAGPVGLFAVFQLGMLKIKAHVIDTLPAAGGQCSALYPEKPIYDIPGFPAINAQDLIKNLEAQAAPFSPVYHFGQQVVSLTPLRAPALIGTNRATVRRWEVTTSTGTVIRCKAVIIAAGCGAFGPNRPPLKDIEKYENTSVHYMVSKREAFRDQDIVIAGGGDSAVDWAVSLAEVARKIYVVHRRDKFRAAADMVDKMQALASTGKIEMVVPYQLEGLEEGAGIEACSVAPSPLRGGSGRGASSLSTTSPPPTLTLPREGGGKLSAVIVKSMDGELRTLPAQHLLAFFGLSMELGPIAEWGLNLDMNHIQVDRGTSQTSAAGIFAIGDIATYDHKLKLILCGFAEAAQAAHAIRDIVYPDTAYHFEYSTSKGVSIA